MPKFQYTALDAAGKTRKGVLAAQDETELHTMLQADGLFLLETKSAEKIIKNRPLKATELATFNRDLSTMLKAGVPLVRALSIQIQEEGIKPKARKLYNDILIQVRQGISMSEAMESQNGAFPTLMIYMYRAAESAGNLDSTAARLAIHYDKEHRLNAKIKSATTYPKFLCFLMVIVVTVLVGYVLPQFDSLFAMMDELPLPTRILYGITDFVKGYWYLAIAGVVGFVVGMKALLHLDGVKYVVDKCKVRMPGIGKLFKVIYTARFARTLSSLYAAGIPIVTILQISKKTIDNSYIDTQFNQLIPEVRSGMNLSDALSRIEGFTSKLSSTVRVGEETGSLDSMLLSIADALDYESEEAIQKLTSYLEPCIIVVMAIVVGFIMVAVMMPIYASYNAIGGGY